MIQNVMTDFFFKKSCVFVGHFVGEKLGNESRSITLRCPTGEIMELIKLVYVQEICGQSCSRGL